MDVEFEMELLKVNCEEEFHSWFDETKAFAGDLDIQVSTPRVASRQAHRSNVPLKWKPDLEWFIKPR